MSDELSNALAELAEGLGTTTGELWSWMQSYGIDAYARAKIAQLSVICVHAVALFVLGLVLLMATYRHYKQSKRSYTLDGEDALIMGGITLILISMLILGIFAPDLFGWITSPEGMVISELIGRL